MACLASGCGMTVAYQQGQEAAKNGWDRISPYTGLKAEVDWYAGYDSVDKVAV